MQKQSIESSRILVAGGHGMVGSALVRLLSKLPCTIINPRRHELDFTDQRATFDYLASTKPDIVIVAAARVGGILANASYPAAFLQENLAIALNLIHGAHLANIERLLYLSSSCIYPKKAASPIAESALLTGPLEPTNEAYALAKIAAVKLVQFYNEEYGRNYIAAMPTNLYGPGDRYDEKKSHVIPALMQRFHRAKLSSTPEVSVWGTGSALREFLYVDDLAEGCLFLLRHYFDPLPINVGSGEEIAIGALAEMIQEVTGYKGRIVFDPKWPEGTVRKLIDSSKIRALGWQPKTGLKQGLELAYADYIACSRACPR